MSTGSPSQATAVAKGEARGGPERGHAYPLGQSGIEHPWAVATSCRALPAAPSPDRSDLPHAAHACYICCADGEKVTQIVVNGVVQSPTSAPAPATGACVSLGCCRRRCSINSWLVILQTGS